MGGNSLLLYRLELCSIGVLEFPWVQVLFVLLIYGRWFFGGGSLGWILEMELLVGDVERGACSSSVFAFGLSDVNSFPVIAGVLEFPWVQVLFVLLIFGRCFFYCILL